MQRTYTDQDRARAVIVRQQNRIARATADPVMPKRRKIRVPRTRARFVLQVRDLKIGDSLTLRLTALPWRGRFVDSKNRELSTSQILTAVKETLNHD